VTASIEAPTDEHINQAIYAAGVQWSAAPVREVIAHGGASDTDALRKALVTGTPLPWFALDFEPEYPLDRVCIIGLRLDADGSPMHTPTNGLVACATLLPTEVDALDAERAEANAALIVAAVNAAPTLLDEVDRLRANLAERDTEITTLRAKADALAGALERLHRNFYLLLQGHPVRDVAETDAEVTSALTAHRETGEAGRG